jgi:hypothetical protein
LGGWGCRGNHELLLGGGKVTLQGIRNVVLMLPHEGSDVFTLMGYDSGGRDKSEVGSATSSRARREREVVVTAITRAATIASIGMGRR